jgi:hypothetical protein
MSSVFQAANTVGTLTQAQITYWDRKFVKNLKGNTPFIHCTDVRYQPANAGIYHALFMYQALGGNTAQIQDGSVGSPIQISVNTNQATLGEFGDYTTFSAFALAAALDNPLVSSAAEMSYRAAQSLNSLVRATADSLVNIDPTVSNNIISGNALAMSDVVSNQQSLVGRGVRPVDGGMFCGVMHPFIWGDLRNGTTVNNSVVDILKYTEAGQRKLDELSMPDQDIAIELPGTGVKFHQSPFVTQVPNLHNTSTGLTTYIFGEEAIISIFLKVPGDTSVEKGDWRKINTYTGKFTPSAFDPEGTIGGTVSYRFHYAASAPPDTTMRARTVAAVSAVS